MRAYPDLACANDLRYVSKFDSSNTWILARTVTVSFDLICMVIFTIVIFNVKLELADT